MVLFGRNGRFHGNHLKKVGLDVKRAFWLSIGPFEVYLPPLYQLQGSRWCHYSVARASSCLATDILYYNSLETRENINHRDNLPIPTPSILAPRTSVVPYPCSYGPWLPSNRGYLHSNQCEM